MSSQSDLWTQFRQKTARAPLRVGLPVGFFVLPLAWMIQDRFLRLLQPHLMPRDLTDYFSSSAVFGAILIGCAFQAWGWRAQNKLLPARLLLLIVGMAGALSWVGLRAGNFGNNFFVEFNGIPLPSWLSSLVMVMIQLELPFFVALAMVGAALVLRGARTP